MKKRKILIIDDELDILKTTKYALEDAGYKVYTVDNGEEGLMRLKTVNPDLILLDLLLPGRTGFQIAQEIKSKDEYKNIPIIVISGKTAAVDKYIAVKKGVVEYIEKPIDMDRLLFHINDILQNIKKEAAL